MLGIDEGKSLGIIEGYKLGILLGCSDGRDDRILLGKILGKADGLELGF